MSTTIIVYASMSGNTEEMAEAVAEGVQAAGGMPELKSVLDADADELAGYDGIILGAYTWGDGELPDEFLAFFDAMAGLNLSGKRAAAFGSGDAGYPIFCGAVDILAERLAELGADVSPDRLKVEYNPTGEEKEACRALGRSFGALPSPAL